MIPAALDPSIPLYRNVSMGLIDEPDLPTREQMDAEKLRELASNIAAEGLQQAIGVEERGVRFAIIYGHRRYVASKMNGASTILARIYPAGCDRAIAIQAGENAFREKVNPAEEGEWYAELYETRCDRDVVKLCALVGQAENYVCSRLLAAQGDKNVLAALKAKQISLSVALELNRITADDLRYYYLESAKNTGASARQMKLWRSQAEQIIASRSGQYVESGPAAEPVAAAQVNENRCACCASTHDVHQMVWIQVHDFCNKAIVEPFLRRRREAEPS